MESHYEGVYGFMKDLNLIVWLTQLGLSFAIPLASFLVLAVWLNRSFGWGNWVIWVGLIIGLSSAISSFRSSLQIMEKISDWNKKGDPPPVSFNDHI